MTEHPVATLVAMPVAGEPIPFLPVVILRDKGICLEALQYARQYSAAVSSSTLRTKVATIARFLNFFNLFVGDQKLTVDQQTNVIFAYIDFRLSGTKQLDDDNPLKLLDWDGISKEYARTEFGTILEFFDNIKLNAEEHIEEVKLLNTVKFSLADTSRYYSRNYTEIAQKDFFIHLRKSREFWANLRDPQYVLPRWARPTATRALFRPFPSTDEVMEVISAEKNPVYKAVFIALAFGSHRVSEVLHSWQCDVLPSFERTKFFQTAANNNNVLFIIAHPEDSTYGTDGKTQTRANYLKQRYGLTVRTQLDKNDTLRIGWKSKLLYGAYKTTDTFWLHPQAASMFADCVDEINDFHLHNLTSRKHPYLFVNIHAKDEAYGEPLKYNRLAKALAQAYMRVGIDPSRTKGRNVHGFRHYAKWYAQNVLGLGPSQIQIIRGDQSIASQDDYGRDAMRLQSLMSQTSLPQLKLD